MLSASAVCHAPAFNESPQNDARSSAIVILLLLRRQAVAEAGICTTGSLSTAALFPLTGLPLKKCPPTTGRGCAAREIPDSSAVALSAPSKRGGQRDERSHTSSGTLALMWHPAILVLITPFDLGFRSFERNVLPVAVQKNMAVFSMKSMSGSGEPIVHGALLLRKHFPTP
jgi:hypothetical protein